MAEITHGTVSVTVDDLFTPPERAGKMSPPEVSRIPKPPRGIGLACEGAADAMEKAPAFIVPGVNAEMIRQAGKRAEGADFLISDLEVILTTVKQANLLFDAEAWELLRRVNDQIKAQGKHDPSVRAKFASVAKYFARMGAPKKEPEEPLDEEPLDDEEPTT